MDEKEVKFWAKTRRDETTGEEVPAFSPPPWGWFGL
jgi:hypothetical protein